MKQNGYLKEAKRLYALAKSELARSKKPKNETKARQAAEKGYLSLMYAIRAVFAEKGVTSEQLPQSERGIRYFLVKYGDREIREKYSKIRHDLHIDAFHEGIILFTDLDERFEDLKELIEQIEAAQ